jgi:hypothetical protein
MALRHQQLLEQQETATLPAQHCLVQLLPVIKDLLYLLALGFQ